jgi:hypothetical protein
MTKLQMAAKIIDYIHSDDKYFGWNWGNRYYITNEISILLAMAGIDHEGEFNFQTIKSFDEETLNRLYNKIFNNNLADFFDNKHAIEALNQENFSNLNLYLNECLNCINADTKIAAAILLRSCIEIFINLFDDTSKKLPAKIDKFFKDIDDNKVLKIFCEHKKQDQLKAFFEGVKNLGDWIVHNDEKRFDGQKITDFIDKHDSKNLLVLLCVLIENSILKHGIEKITEESQKNKIQSIDFTIKEKSQKCDIDDEIPF